MKSAVLLFSCLILLFVNSACKRSQEQISILPSPKSDNINYIGRFYKGNYVWDCSINLAWNEISNNIFKEKIQLDTKDTSALHTLYMLNNPVITKESLDNQNYHFKNMLLYRLSEKLHFKNWKLSNNQRFIDIKCEVSNSNITIHTNLNKRVIHGVPFSECSMTFQGQSVHGFEANYYSWQNVRIINYVDRDHFLINVRQTSNNDLVFLAKGYPMDTPDSIISYIKSLANPRNVKYPVDYMTKDDVFQAPNIFLKNYWLLKEMTDKSVVNGSQRMLKNSKYIIKKVSENIIFIMDEKGNLVRNNSGSAEIYKFNMRKIPPRIMILDKSFWIILVHKNSDNLNPIIGINNKPYLILGINNTYLMEPINDRLVKQ